MKRHPQSDRPAKLTTGIPGLDAIAEGGLPRSGVTVVLGGVGTGKTIFGLQVLAAGHRDRGEPGILVAFEESAARILENSAGFVWGGAPLADGAVHVLDAQLPQSALIGGEFDLVGLLGMVAATAKKVGASTVVFDGLDVLLGFLGDSLLVRRESLRLRDWAHASGLAVIVTAKVNAEQGTTSDYDFLSFMADCLITLHHRVVDATALRFLRISKYRGAAHSANELPLAITNQGLEVAANTTIELSYPTSTERISTGVERLDAMLAGGYYRGSSVLITGAPGTAKTSLAAAFAQAAAIRGERTAYVSFDEAPGQIIRNVASIDIQLAPYIASGVLRLHSLRPRTESPDAHVARIRMLLRDTEPRNLIIDPLSALIHRGHEADAEGAALQLLDFAKCAGITIVSTSLLGQANPLTEHTPLNISTIADTWMHVSYVSQGGERNRALTIVKARGTGHSNQVRELILSDAGVSLADVYSVGGEVLMGTLRWEKENRARQASLALVNDGLLRRQRAELAIAHTRARVEELGREQAIQQAELDNILAGVVAESRTRAVEVDELLLRRQADPDQATESALPPRFHVTP